MGVTDLREDEVPVGPPLPLGRRIELPDRGITFVRELPGPTEDAPALLLLHGWIASAGLNWFQTFDALSEHFRVIALDQRGHGRGMRTWKRFRLADCADDAAALIDILALDPVIVVGYSMGGTIAQLLCRRHPHLADEHGIGPAGLTDMECAPFVALHPRRHVGFVRPVA